ncbi:alanine-glyoxylate transaminase/serine-glyoxylate transaminase/serine-pyruvate transaminase [Shimia isoporae]|uniref:Alanine-glyoxylate transaminase/serine-glyoxylate transaminase/serine-pyruvate transaminase n=1 Tax=Shimia isoporae TaxID=647720 RepID=A0A4R1NSH4_9RHOB|nr:aminotransferase class V-fold PLP-dependent enzyme [Shimia isoporae]TCL08208.1 alanine-glyoxylate transaminase/serine-glyoxylate transaminase/serine-pyruvate transaminase [Shimia isoporae]
MTLAHGQTYLAIPGPSVMPEAVLREMHRGAPNIYEGELIDLTYGLLPDLKMVAGTAHDVAIYIGNGHAAWEASLANVLAPDDKVLVPVAGSFGLGWGDVAQCRGIETDVIDFGRRAPIDPARVAEALAADTDHKIKAVLAVHVDTSTSAKSDIPAIRAAIDSVGHPALLMVDCIASLGCDRFEMDAWGADVMVAASQKGLMVPPGAAFVFFNDKAQAARAGLDRVSKYWDWQPRANPELYYQLFCGTAPTHHLYGLRVALDMIKDEGLEAVWARHEVLAKAIWAAGEAWGRGGPFELNIADAAARSHAVTSLRIGKEHGTRLRRWCQDQAGLTLGIGLGMSTEDDPKGDGFFRFGHMGHVNAQMILGMLATVQTGLRVLDIPHGAGALEAAADVIGQA